MQTHGYERSAPWRQSLALMKHLAQLTDAFEDDAFSMAGKLRTLAADLPILSAYCYEQIEYDRAKANADEARQHLFKLLLQAQVAAHLGLIDARQLTDLRKKLDALEDAITQLPDELFEDDAQPDLEQAA